MAPTEDDFTNVLKARKKISDMQKRSEQQRYMKSKQYIDKAITALTQARELYIDTGDAGGDSAICKHLNAALVSVDVAETFVHQFSHE